MTRGGYVKSIGLYERGLPLLEFDRMKIHDLDPDYDKIKSTECGVWEPLLKEKETAWCRDICLGRFIWIKNALRLMAEFKYVHNKEIEKLEKDNIIFEPNPGYIKKR